MKGSLFALLWALAVLSAGCEDSTFYISGLDGDALPDVPDDTTMDVVPDVQPDTAPDMTPDTTPDTVPDTLPDTTPDTTPDTLPDTTPDPDVVDDPDVTTDPDIVDDPGVCSGHGTAYTWSDGTFCACEAGYSPSSPEGTDCVPTSTICTGGPLSDPIDVTGDGVPDDRFDPSALECRMYELVNYTRATHDNEGTPECHFPLMYNLVWSAHGRNHSFEMYEAGGLFHADYPSGQNCAYGCDPACEMNMYMNGSGEDHCPPLSHHCNIMRCSFGQIGIGYWTPESGTWNTQNFL
jgi:hypothetical protein